MGRDAMSARAERTPRLRRELVITLLLKFAAISVLWLLFFSHPVDEGLNGAQVGNSVFGAAPDASRSRNTSSSNEENKR